MANKIFRQVLCSERLPKEDGMYICSRNNVFSKIGLLLFNHEEPSYWLSYVDYWLEEVELPSEDVKEDLSKDFAVKIQTRVDTISRLNAESWFKAGFKKAIELIKGEGLNNG